MPRPEKGKRASVRRQDLPDAQAFSHGGHRGIHEAYLNAYTWTGNGREPKNVVEQAAILAHR